MAIKKTSKSTKSASTKSTSPAKAKRSKKVVIVSTDQAEAIQLKRMQDESAAAILAEETPLDPPALEDDSLNARAERCMEDVNDYAAVLDREEADGTFPNDGGAATLNLDENQKKAIELLGETAVIWTKVCENGKKLFRVGVPAIESDKRYVEDGKRFWGAGASYAQALKAAEKALAPRGE